jgi:hypothetical protein
MIGTMKINRAAELQVYVEDGCQTCDRAVRLVKDVESEYPQLAVRVTDIGGSACDRSDVFAVPTYVLDDRVFSLGNPQPDHLRREIESLLARRGLL